MDLEMTGLDPERHVILEVATLITNADLEVVAEGPEIAVRRDAPTLAAMDDWCTTTHTASGLVERVVNSAVFMAEADAATLAFIEQWVAKEASPA